MKDKNNVFFRICILSCLFLFLIACNESKIEYTLGQAGENKIELERFLLHYSEDEQKKEAAEFLIAGMGNKCFYEGELIEHYDTIFSIYDSLYNTGIDEGDLPIITETWKKMEQQYGKLTIRRLKKKWDSRVLDSHFLIDNLEQAFDAWKYTSDFVSRNFNDFCEYVLPYRASNEIPEVYRKRYREELVNLCDTTKSGVEGLILGFYKEFALNRRYRYCNTLWKYPIALPVSKMEKGHHAACRHATTFYASVMRACGLPVAIDYVKAWGNRSMGHEWNVLLLDSGKIYPFDAFNGKRLKFDYKPAKIFRRKFSLTSGDVLSLKDVPSYLTLQDELDVTEQYGDVYDISIPCLYPWNENGKKQYAVICVFDNVEWKPVYYGKIKNGQMVFRKMMGDVCYMAGYYNQGKVIPANEPFILKKNGSVEYLKINKNVCLNMVLNRKYPRFPRMELLATHIRRGKVKGANDRQFLNSTLLFDIMGTPNDIVDSLVNVHQSFRYLQVEPAIYRTGDLAEIEFYGKNNLNEPERKLTGRVFGFPTSPIDNGHPYTHAMDGDYETYYSKEKDKEGYVALDLGSSYYITRVRFCPRSDTNFIIPGHKYELCYWDSRWESVASKVASGLTISFENVPGNTFYILHDQTRGKEERIFTYENGEQVWW